MDFSKYLLCVLFMFMLTICNVRSQTSESPTTIEESTEEVTEDTTTVAGDVTTEDDAGNMVTAYNLQLFSFAFADNADDLDFDFNVDNIYEMTITLKNIGGNNIKSISADGDSTNNGADNFAIYFIVSDTDNLDDTSAMTLQTAADVSDASNIQAGISSGSSIVIADVFAMINIPKADCGLYTHLCVKVEATSGAVWSDSDSSNDYSCIESFGYEDAEYLPCSGCISRASLLVIFLAMLTQLLSL